jgi:hypothetical protein
LLMQQQTSTSSEPQLAEKQKKAAKTYKWFGTFIIKDGRYTFFSAWTIKNSASFGSPYKALQLLYTPASF